MILDELKLNRFMYKSDPDPVQNGAVYMSENINSKKNLNSKNNTNEDPKDAKQIVTGTVITDCIIQTSGLPHRVLIQDNDITFFDDTNVVDGKFIGDTSRLIFQSAAQLDPNNPNGAFIMEKRVSINDPLDSVLSWYSTPPVPGHHNWLFIGRNGDGNDAQRNLSVVAFNIDAKTADVPVDGKPYGSYRIEYSENSIYTGIPLMIGNSKAVFNPSFNGFSGIFTAGDGGIVGLAYKISLTVYNVILYVTSSDGKINFDGQVVVNEASGGRMSVGRVSSVASLPGTQGDIVFNTSDSKFYGCTVTSLTAATWSALN